MGKGRQRNLGSPGGAYEDILQRIRVLVKLRGHLHDHVILVQLPVHGRNLPLAKGIVQRVIHILRTDSQPGGGVAVNDNLLLQAAVLLIGRDVGQLMQHPQFLQQARRPGIQVVEVFAFQGVLEL